MKLYLASSWRNSYQPAVLAALRAGGHDVYDFRNPAPGDTGFGWRQCDPELTSDLTVDRLRRALAHPAAERGFRFDFDAMRWADAFVLLLPSGMSAHLEAGWACGAGKPVVVLAPELREPELMYKCFDDGRGAPLVATVEEALAYLAGTKPAARLAAEVIATGDDYQLLRTSLGEWGVGEVSAVFSEDGQATGDQVVATWRATEDEARAFFADVRGKRICETCSAEVDADDLTEAGEDGPRVCPACVEEIANEDARRVAAFRVKVAALPPEECERRVANLIAALFDDDGEIDDDWSAVEAMTDDEVRAELEAGGVDVDAYVARTRAFIDDLLAKRRGGDAPATEATSP